jgi:hypothetical protein
MAQLRQIAFADESRASLHPLSGLHPLQSPIFNDQGSLYAVKSVAPPPPTPTVKHQRVEDFANELTAKLNKYLHTIEGARHESDGQADL